MVNVVARSSASFDAALASLRAAFPVLLQADAEDDVNRVLFAKPHAAEQAPPPPGAVVAALERVATKPWDKRCMDVAALAAGMRAVSAASDGTDAPQDDELD